MNPNKNDRPNKTAIGILAEAPKQQYKLAFCLVLLLCNVSHGVCFCIPQKVFLSANYGLFSTTTTTYHRIVRSIATTNTNHEFESTATTTILHNDMDSELVVSDADIKTLGKFKSSLTKVCCLLLFVGLLLVHCFSIIFYIYVFYLFIFFQDWNVNIYYRHVCSTSIDTFPH